MAASARGHAKAVRLLIKAGADVNARTSNGETALKLAQKGRYVYVEVVRLLKSSGARE